VLDGPHDKLPRLLLDRNQLTDIPKLERGPGVVKGDQSVGKVWSARLSIGAVRDDHGLKSVHDRDDVDPRLLQGLREIDRLFAELELLAVHPDGKLLVDAGLEHVNAVMAIVVGKQGAVVGRKFGAVLARRDLQA